MTVVLTVTPGGVLKREIVEQAFDALGISDYEPEEAVKALSRLNAMMLEDPWNALGYEQPGYGAGLLTDESGVDRAYLAACAYELAIRTAPTIGKASSAELRRNAAAARRSLPVTIPTVGFASGTPRGAGSRRYGAFIPTGG